MCRAGRCLCCHSCFFQTDRINYFFGGDWVTGPKQFFETGAALVRGDLAGKNYVQGRKVEPGRAGTEVAETRLSQAELMG